MNTLGPLGLPTWIDGHADKARFVLAGSATPGISISDLVSLSTEPVTTAANLNVANIPLNLGTFTGSLALRQTIAALFPAPAPTTTGRRIIADDVLIMNGTTGANFALSQALLSPGDHVVVVYPTYMPLIANAKGAGAEVSLWNLNPERAWQPSLDELKTLVRKGKTKMIVLNSPGNPTGRYLRKELLQGVFQIAREIGAVVHCDEIFHPLYHFDDEAARTAPESFLSLADKDFDQVVVTGSLSKAWGMSGLRIGWIVSPNKDIINKSFEMKSHIVQTVSTIDETIANEALSERCRPGILKKNLSFARTNLPVLKEFGNTWEARKRVLFVTPEAGAVAFVKFMGGDGQAVDDVQFCEGLLATEGTLLSPGTLSFGDEWKGYCRLHFNIPPETFREGLEAIDRYLEKVQ